MFISDQETAVDCLHYQPIARTLVNLVKESGEMPVTIGIHGDWGAGKSSVLAMAELRFKQEDNILCIRFNGWRFQGFEDAKASLIESIITEIKESQPGIEKVKEIATDLLKRVDLLKLSKKTLSWGGSLLSGIPTPGVISDTLAMFSVLKPRDSWEEAKPFLDGILKPKEEENIPEQMVEFDKLFAELIDQAGLKKVVVLIDDLDRCLPETAIETLEAIRLFLFSPKTAFIVAADEGMIEYSVRRHFPDLPQGPVKYAQNYLEKLIQVPFRIPALGLVETQIYVTLLLAQAELGPQSDVFGRLLEKAKDIMVRPWMGEMLDTQIIQDVLAGQNPGVYETLRIGPQIYRILAEGTSGNPRQVKRFISALLLRRTIAKERGFDSDIKLPHLAKIMLAERFRPEFFEQLTKTVSQQPDGKSPEIALLESSKGAQEDNKGDDQKQSEWQKDGWITSWAQIEPQLSNEDLRPYLFLTRDKKGAMPGFVGAAHLTEFMEILLGEQLAIQANREKLLKISQSDAEILARFITTKVSETGEFKLRPQGIMGLTFMIEHHHGARSIARQFLETLDPSQVGAWAGQLLATIASYPEETEKCEQLRERWVAEGSHQLKSILKVEAKVPKTGRQRR